MSLDDFNHIKNVLTELNTHKPSRFGYTEAALNATGQAEIDAINGEYIIDDATQINSIPSPDMVGIDPVIIDIGLRTQAATIPRMAINHFFGRLSLNLLKLTEKLNLLVKDHLVSRYITPSGNVLEHITVSPQADVVTLIQHQSSLSASAPVTASAAITIPAAIDSGNAGVMTGTDKKNLVDILTRDVTLAGVKTFSSIPVLPASNPTTDNQAARRKYVADLDAQNVKLTGAQTIADIKTFSSIPVLPASNPTTDNQAARKAYVDAQITGNLQLLKNSINANGYDITNVDELGVGTTTTVNLNVSNVTKTGTGVVANFNADMIDNLHETNIYHNLQDPAVFKSVTVLLSGYDLNSIRATGIYEGLNLVNAPSAPVGSWYHIEHIEHKDNNGYGFQRATLLFTTDTYIRYENNFNWGPWKKFAIIDENGQMTIRSANPVIKMLDDNASADDFWLYIDSNCFYVLTDRADDGQHESPFPLELQNDTGKGFVYGDEIVSVAASQALSNKTFNNVTFSSGSISESIKIKPLSQYNNSLHGSYNSNSVFQALTSVIPGTGNCIKLNGVYCITGNNPIFASKALRYDINTIVIFGCWADGSPQTENAVNGSSTSIACSISW